MPSYVFLRINYAETGHVHPITLITSLTVEEAVKETLAQIHGQFSSHSDGREFGFYRICPEYPTIGSWFGNERTLDYYMVRDGHTLNLINKMKILKVRTLDGITKTIRVDVSQNVSQFFPFIGKKFGITNLDQFSLLQEKEEENRSKPSEHGSLTRKTSRSMDKDLDNKTLQLKKKLKTDDELHWIDPGRTLLEQGIDDNSTLILRRKLFYNDENIDESDPIQLNLLYAQAKDAILEGKHPVTFKKAIMFAGIQRQILLGNYRQAHAKPINLKEFLPKSYVKKMGAATGIVLEHKINRGIADYQAKRLYVKNAMDLDTYGVSFFLVKEQDQQKKKVFHRLLGIKKDCIMTLDVKTKETVNRWELTAVKAWSSTLHMIHVDFGEYNFKPYSAWTYEGAQISEILSGYIDIIRKKMEAKEYYERVGKEEMPIKQESVHAHRAEVVTRSCVHDSISSDSTATYDSVATPPDLHLVEYDHVAPQFTSTPNTHETTDIMHQTSLVFLPDTALTQAINNSREVVEAALIQIDDSSPAIIQAETLSRFLVTEVGASTAAAHQVILLAEKILDDPEENKICDSVNRMAANIRQLVTEVKILAKLRDDESNLKEAIRDYLYSFLGVLKYAHPQDIEDKPTVFQASNHVVQSSCHLLQCLRDHRRENESRLLILTRISVSQTAQLISKSKSIALEGGNVLGETLIKETNKCADASTNLLSCVQDVGSSTLSQSIKHQIENCIAEQKNAVDMVVSLCKQLDVEARDVMKALNEILNYVQEYAEDPMEHVVEVVSSADRLLVQEVEHVDLMEHADTMQSLTSRLLQSLQTKAEEDERDNEVKKKLVNAASKLATATTDLAILAGEQMTTQDHQRAEFTKSVTSLRDVVLGAFQLNSIQTLENAVYHANAATPQYIILCQQTGLFQCEEIKAYQPDELNKTIEESQKRLGDEHAQQKLIHESESFLYFAEKLTESASMTMQQNNGSSRQLRMFDVKYKIALAKVRDALEIFGRLRSQSNYLYDEVLSLQNNTDMLQMETEKEGNDSMLALARSVANNTIQLTAEVKVMSSQSSSYEPQFYAIKAAKQCVQAAQRLISYVQSVSPDINEKNLKEIKVVAQTIRKLVDNLVQICRQHFLQHFKFDDVMILSSDVCTEVEKVLKLSDDRLMSQTKQKETYFKTMIANNEGVKENGTHSKETWKETDINAAYQFPEEEAGMQVCSDSSFQDTEEESSNKDDSDVLLQQTTDIKKTCACDDFVQDEVKESNMKGDINITLQSEGEESNTEGDSHASLRYKAKESNKKGDSSDFSQDEGEEINKNGDTDSSLQATAEESDSNGSLADALKETNCCSSVELTCFSHKEEDTASTDQSLVEEVDVLIKDNKDLIQSIKGEAEQEDDSKVKEGLLEASSKLASATSELVKTVNEYTEGPDDQGDKLRNSISSLRVVARIARLVVSKKKTVQRLRQERAKKEQSSSTEESHKKNDKTHEETHETGDSVTKGNNEVSTNKEAEDNIKEPHDDTRKHSTSLITDEEYCFEDFSDIRLQEILESAASKVAEAANHLATSTPVDMEVCSLELANSIYELVACGKELRNRNSGTLVEEHIPQYLHIVSTNANNLILAMRNVHMDMPDKSTSLHSFLREITEATSKLVNLIPVQKECNNAIDRISSLYHLLYERKQPKQQMTYQQCVDAIVDKCNLLGNLVI